MKKFELPEQPQKTNTSKEFTVAKEAIANLDKFDYAWKTYSHKIEKRFTAAIKYIEELERENQRLIAENVAVKTLVDKAKPQQALPVVPEFVADWIEILKTKGLKPLKNRETYGETGFTEEKLQNIVFWISENQEDYMRAWLGGYTVEKPQLFYLKNKLTGLWLMRDEVDKVFPYDHTFDIRNRDKFTQQEIDSMQTGSYEQIKVEEEK